MWDPPSKKKFFFKFNRKFNMLMLLAFLYFVTCGVALSLREQLSTEAFVPGSLNATIVADLSIEIKSSSFSNDLDWFATHTTFFSFQTMDNITLQAYFIPPSRDILSAGLIIYLAGFSETILKNVKFLRMLNELGYTIFSYDMRGQGFSQLTGYDQGKVSHINSFSLILSDLNVFITKIIPTRLDSLCSTIEEKCTNENDGMYYIGNSFGAMIGLTYLSQHPNQFKKIIAVAPLIKVIQPYFIEILCRVLKFAGKGTMLTLRFDEDITKLKLTRDKRNLESWIQLRELAHDQVVIQGSSVDFFIQMVEGTRQLHSNAINITSPVLILQADDDDMVDNNAITQFVSKLKRSPLVRLVKIRDTYHELLIETDAVFGIIASEVKYFLTHSFDLN